MVSQIAARFLVRAVHVTGAKITVANGRPSVTRPRKGAQSRLALLMPRLVEHREAILDYLEVLKGGLCHVCKGSLTDTEDQERLAGVNPFCSRGVTIPPKPWLNQPGYVGCPYRRSP